MARRLQIRTNYTKSSQDAQDWGGYFYRNVPTTFTITDPNCKEPTNCPSLTQPATSVSLVCATLLIWLAICILRYDHNLLHFGGAFSALAVVACHGEHEVMECLLTRHAQCLVGHHQARLQHRGTRNTTYYHRPCKLSKHKLFSSCLTHLTRT